MAEVILIILRSVSVYLFIILAIRFFGKKELSQLSIIDLVFILLISNSVQNAMVGNNTSLAGGLTAAGALFIVNWTLKNFIYRSKGLSQAIQGSPVMLIYGGKIIKKHLEAARISPSELEAAVREHGVNDISEVDLAVLEVDGQISVLSKNFNRRTKKRRLHKSLSFTN